MTHQSKYNKKMSVRIDATHKPLGRLASEVAMIVRGKNRPSFLPHRLPAVEITISNIEKIGISEKKLDAQTYKWFTRYPGGLKSKKWRELLAKNPRGLFLNAVKRMLPANRLRAPLLKMIKFD
jgi:large subunit ribosomal protein L13